MPTSRLTRIDRLNQLTHVEPCSSMKEVLGKIETWEQAWAKYEEDNSVTLDIDLKLGALLKMLPSKQEEAIKLRYIEDENKLTYPVLRRQVELWLEAISQGPAPMDISSLEPADLAKMSEEQLEQALDVLRQGKAGGKDKGRTRAAPSEKDPNRKIDGKCWNCGKEGHTAQACRQPKKPKGKGKKGGGRGVNSCDEEDDDEEDADDQSMGMLGLASLEEEDESDVVRVRGKWVTANPRDLDICMFEGTTVSGSEDEDDDDDDDNNEEDELRDELTEAIEKQLASRRVIEKEVAKEEEAKDEEWRAPKRPVKKSAQIRGTPLTEAYMNPFASIAENIEIDSSSESILDRHLKRMGAATATSSIPSSSVPPSSPCAAVPTSSIPSSSVSPASPGTLSSISPIRTSSGKAQEAVHHRLDTSIDSPPGLEGVTIRINGIGSESVFIMGKIVNES